MSHVKLRVHVALVLQSLHMNESCHI